MCCVLDECTDVGALSPALKLFCFLYCSVLLLQEQCSALQAQLHDLLSQRAGSMVSDGPPLPRKRTRHAGQALARDEAGAGLLSVSKEPDGERQTAGSGMSWSDEDSCSKSAAGGSDTSAGDGEEDEEDGNGGSQEEDKLGRKAAGRHRLWGTRVVQLRVQLEVAEAAQREAEAVRAAAQVALQGNVAGREAAEARAQDLAWQLQEAEKRCVDEGWCGDAVCV